jgi:hypothetical protein
VGVGLRIRRQLVRAEPSRLDLAVELAYVLSLWAQIGTPGDAGAHAAQEAIGILEPFEQLGYLTPTALNLLTWARQVP